MHHPENHHGISDLTQVLQFEDNASSCFIVTQILQLHPSAVILTDTEGTIQFVNQKFCDISGYSSKEAIGQKPSLLKSGQQSESFYKELWETITQGTAWCGEFYNKRKDGSFFWEQASISPLRNQKGEITHFLAIKENISKQKGLETALDSSEKQYKALFESMQSACCILEVMRNEDQRAENLLWIRCNSSYEKMLGFSTSELKGKLYSDVLPASELRFWLRTLEPALQKHQRMELEYFHQASEKWYETVAFPIGDDQLGCIFMDITHRKEGDQRNKILVEKQEVKVRQLQLLYWLASMGANERLDLPHFIQQSLHALDRFFWDRKMVSTVIWDGDVYGTAQEENSANLYQKELKIEDHQAQILIGAKTFLKDNDFRREEKVLDIFFHEWVHVAEMKLREARLLEQQEQIFQASKLVSLGELTSGVAHEINNPANFILLNAGIMDELKGELLDILKQADPEKKFQSNNERNYDEISADYENFVNSIQEGAIRIRNIVQNLKEYSRMQGDEKPGPVKAAEVTKSAISIIHNEIKKSTRNFECRVSEDLPALKGHFHQVEQVLINLISNACRSLNDRTAAVIIDASVTPDDLLEISVEDEGEGIPPENLAKLTDPFFTTFRTRGGTGLGLSICHRIIENHHGHMNFESTPGKGTRVSLLFPLAEGSAI